MPTAICEQWYATGKYPNAYTTSKGMQNKTACEMQMMHLGRKKFGTGGRSSRRKSKGSKSRKGRKGRKTRRH